MYVWSKLRNRNFPTLTDLKKAQKLADDETNDRDPRNLMSALMRMEAVNERIRGMILTRKTAITSFGWTISPEEGQSEKEISKIEARLKPAIDSILKFHVQKPLYGALCIELDWDTESPYGTAPKVVRRYAPVELDKIDDLHLATLADDDDLIRQEEIDLQDLENVRFIADVDDSYLRGGILRALIRWQIIREDMVLEWANVNKRLKGIVHGVIKGATEEEKRKAANQMISIISENFAISGEDLDFNFHSITNPNAHDSIHGLLNKFDTDASIAILGQANTTELPNSGGSRAALQIMKMISADIHYADMISVENLCNRLLLYDWKMNKQSDATETPLEFRLNIPEELDLESRAAFIAELKETKLPVNSQQVYDMLNMTRPDGVPDILTWDEAAPNIPGIDDED